MTLVARYEIRDDERHMALESAFSRLAVAAPLSLSSTFACDDDDDGLNDAAVLECTGACTWDNSTRTCSCVGGTDYILVGEGAVTFSWDGNASCGLSRGDDCIIICPGTAGCIGAAVTCEDQESCDLSDCRGRTDCGAGVYACGRACAESFSHA